MTTAEEVTGYEESYGLVTGYEDEVNYAPEDDRPEPVDTEPNDRLAVVETPEPIVIGPGSLPRWLPAAALSIPWWEYPAPQRSVMQRVLAAYAAAYHTFADVEGHPFHGNQYTGGISDGKSTGKPEYRSGDVVKAPYHRFDDSITADSNSLVEAEARQTAARASLDRAATALGWHGMDQKEMFSKWQMPPGGHISDEVHEQMGRFYQRVSAPSTATLYHGGGVSGDAEKIAQTMRDNGYIKIPATSWSTKDSVARNFGNWNSNYYPPNRVPVMLQMDKGDGAALPIQNIGNASYWGEHESIVGGTFDIKDVQVRNTGSGQGLWVTVKQNSLEGPQSGNLQYAQYAVTHPAPMSPLNFEPVIYGNFPEEFRKRAVADKPITSQFGDTAGHPFHGNQHTGGIGGGDKEPTKTYGQALRDLDDRAAANGIGQGQQRQLDIYDSLSRAAEKAWQNQPAANKEAEDRISRAIDAKPMDMESHREEMLQSMKAGGSFDGHDEQRYAFAQEHPVNLMNFSSGNAKELADRVDKFASEFPGAAQTLESVRNVSDYYIGTNTLGEYTPVGRDANSPGPTPALEFNSDWFGKDTTGAGPVDLAGAAREAADSGFHAEGSVSAIYDHEIGHVLDYDGHPGNSSSAQDAFKEPAETSHLSNYALNAGPNEAFAEAFSVRQQEGMEALAARSPAIAVAMTNVITEVQDESALPEHMAVPVEYASPSGRTCAAPWFPPDILAKYGPKPPITPGQQLGDSPGHPFRGNQHTGGEGGGDKSAPKADEVKAYTPNSVETTDHDAARQELAANRDGFAKVAGDKAIATIDAWQTGRDGHVDDMNDLRQTYGRSNDTTIYRGDSVHASNAEEAAGKFSVGQGVNIPTSSFSANSDWAGKFASWHAEGAHSVPVVYSVPAGGARDLPIAGLSKDWYYASEQEHVSGGAFTVASVTSSDGAVQVGLKAT